MNGRSAKQKGKELEDHVADRIVSMGMDPRARRDGASGAGNREKGDIVTSLQVLGRNAGIECKNQKTLCIPEWWRQTLKLDGLGREPVLVFKQFGEGLDASKVVIYLDTFLGLVKLANQAEGIEPTEENPNERREMRYAMGNLRQAIARVEKLMRREG